MTTKRPSVLFVCVHNAGKSQMAAAYMRRFAGNRVQALAVELLDLKETPVV